MAGKVCAVFGCNNYEIQKNARSFFRFPRDVKLCDQWVVKCGRSDLDAVYENKGPMHLYINYKICSDHFLTSDFRNPQLYSQGLRRGSLPTLNLPSSGILNVGTTSKTGSHKRKREDDEMDPDIQTPLISIVKEEDIVIKEEPLEDDGQYNGEQEKCGVLGNFYQVECSASPMECMEEEEAPQRNMIGCACSKELERLESRMGRLECLLELLVSKVALPQNTASPSPQPISPSPTTSKEAGRSSAMSSNDAGSSKTTASLAFMKLAANPRLKRFADANPRIKFVAVKTHRLQTVPVANQRLKIVAVETSRLKTAAVANPRLKTVPNPRSIHLGKKPMEYKAKSNSATIENNCDLSPFLKAAQIGDLGKVELLLKTHPPLKQVGEALLLASNPSVVELLCRSCPDVVEEPLGQKALLLAAEMGRVPMLQTLLKAGVNPNVTNRVMLTALHKAAAKGHADCVITLLKMGANVSAITSSDWSALHMAAMNGAVVCMMVLVEAGADIEAVDKCGCTPLHYAARWNQFDAVEWLLNKGACWSTKNNRGKTPRELSSAKQIWKLFAQQSKRENLSDEDPVCESFPVMRRTHRKRRSPALCCVTK